MYLKPFNFFFKPSFLFEIQTYFLKSKLTATPKIRPPNKTRPPPYLLAWCLKDVFGPSLFLGLSIETVHIYNIQIPTSPDELIQSNRRCSAYNQWEAAT